MAYFISTSGKSITCYNGTRCSGTKPAELTDEAFISKARRNPDFKEVLSSEPVVKKVTKKKASKKRTTKKRAYKRKAK